MNTRYSLIFITLVLFLASCSRVPEGEIQQINHQAHIYPDYRDVTIPVNIAPLNFLVEEEGDAFLLKLSVLNTQYILTSRDGDFRISEKKWRRMLQENTGNDINYELFLKKKGSWYQFLPFSNHISDARVDPYVYYRLIHPGFYINWNDISIVQRSLESFKEKVLVKNTLVEENCVNCHSFNHQNPDNFMFHMRGTMGGSYFASQGEWTKFDLKTKEMQNGATYPRWHPSGKYLAFSSNKVIQKFHSLEEKTIEVIDLNSSLLLYDVQENEMMQIQVDPQKQFMDTYPEWSPDGKYLYFCRARQIGETYDYRDIKYNLYRAVFHPESRDFEKPELVFDAVSAGKSVSFPRVSPDGNILVFTLHNSGSFSIWHKEADLYSIDLSNFSIKKCKVNSDSTESYHSWSTNSRWLIFSSKRGDGRTARPYMAYMDENGDAHKPFVLPQRNPGLYKDYVMTFNVPEFAVTDVVSGPGKLRRAAKQEALQADWVKK